MNFSTIIGLLNKSVSISVKIKPVYGEMSEEQSLAFFRKFVPPGIGIEVVNENPDYYLLWNYPNDYFFDPKKTLYFKGEPFRYNLSGDWGMKSWNRWAYPSSSEYFFVKNEPSNYVWFLNKSIKELRAPIKKNKELSICLSPKRIDPGHILRIDFAHYLQDLGINLDVYGNCPELNFANYKGVFEGKDQKDNSIFDYKYHIAFENCQETNYFTEKIVDGILGECLVFYWGCPNIGKFFNEECFVKLTGDSQLDAQTIKDSIENNIWESKLHLIKEQKRQILNSKTIMHDIKKITAQSSRKKKKTRARRPMPETKNKLKIAVYAICKNEEQFVERFMDAAKEADAVYVLDTGSTDNCVEKLRSLGAHVEVKTYEKFRFDESRNDSMDMVPEDYDVCVCFDLDEVFEPGWRALLEKTWKPGATRCYYTYHWSHDRVFTYDKIHARKNFRWVVPVHEVLHCSVPETVVECLDITLRHYPDHTKPRSQYLGLLKLSTEELPDDVRAQFYYGRELMFEQQNELAIVELTKYLNHKCKTHWDLEKITAMRFIATCLFRLGNEVDAEIWLKKAIVSGGDRLREPIVDLMKLLFGQKRYYDCYFFAQKCLGITERLPYYIVEGYAWGHEPYDYGARAAWYIGDKEKAIEWGTQAVNFSNEEYLKKNLELFLKN